MSSPAWLFFSVAEDDKSVAVCKTCSARIPRGGKKASSFNTTNLIAHLKSHHRGEAVLSEYEAAAASSVKPKATSTTTGRADVPIQQAFEKSKLFPRDSEKAKAINDKVMEFIALDDQPFCVVENPGFRALIAHLEPHYTLPSRRFFSDVSPPALCNIVASHIHNLIDTNGKQFYNGHMDVRC